MYSMFLSTSYHASLLSLQALQPEKWTCVFYSGLQQGRDAESLFKQGTDTRSSLFCSLWALERSAILSLLLPVCQGRGDHSCPLPWIRAILQVPPASSSPLVLFYQIAHCREKACSVATWSLHQHPGSTGSFWTKIVLPAFGLFPASCCFVCLGGGSLFSCFRGGSFALFPLFSLPAPRPGAGASLPPSLCPLPHVGCPDSIYLVFFLPQGTIWPSSFFVFLK